MRGELYFFHHEDCGFCKEAMPGFKAWEKAHPDVLCVPLNLAWRKWEKYGWSPPKRVTPAYLYAERGTLLGTYVGQLAKAKDIEAFVRQAIEATRPAPPAKRGLA